MIAKPARHHKSGDQIGKCFKPVEEQRHHQYTTQRRPAGRCDEKVDPVLYQVNKSLGSLDSLLTNVNSVVDSKPKKNISDLLDNLKLVTASMVVSAASCSKCWTKETGSLAKA